LVKLIFKTFTLENSKKKGLHILPIPGICNFCLLFHSTHLTKTVFSVHNKLPATLALMKKNNLTEKKTKRFNLIYASVNHLRILQRQFDDGSCFHSPQTLTKWIFLTKNKYFWSNAKWTSSSSSHQNVTGSDL
jgi:hypothetical protein